MDKWIINFYLSLNYFPTYFITSQSIGPFSGGELRRKSNKIAAKCNNINGKSVQRKMQ